MTSPFDDDAAEFLVVSNAGGDLCLWPAWADVPPGWAIAHGPSGRRACLGWIESAVS
jgi:MbtH protein